MDDANDCKRVIGRQFTALGQVGKAQEELFIGWNDEQKSQEIGAK